MNKLRLTSFMMVAAAATLGLATGCSSSSSKGGTGGAGGSAGLGGKGGAAGATGAAGAAGGTTGSTGGAAGGAAGSVGGAAGGAGGSAAGGSAGSAGGAAGGAGGAAGGSSVGGSTGTAGAAGGTAGAGGAGGTAVTTLLVDHDDSDNNQTPVDPAAAPSVSDTLFATRLAAEHIPFATTVVPADPNPTTPHYADLMSYSTILWYTGPSYGQTMSASQEATLKNWLNAGGKTLLIFSQNLFYDLGDSGDWATVNNDTFLTDYLGAAGWVADAVQFVNAQDAPLAHNTYSVTGAAGTAFASLQFTVIADTPIASTADVVNPANGTVPLVTVPADVQTTNANVSAPIAVVRTTAGTAGTSKVLYVGLPVENIQGAPTNTSAEFIHAALKTVALVQ